MRILGPVRVMDATEQELDAGVPAKSLWKRLWKQKLKSAPPLLVLGMGKGLLQVRESGRNQHLPVSVMLICNFQEISSFLICQSTGIKLFIIFHYYFDFLNIFLVMPYFSFQILFSHVFFIFDQSS